MAAIEKDTAATAVGWVRTAHVVAAGVCAGGALLALMMYGTLALGLVSFYFCVASGVTHAAQLLGWTPQPTARHAVAALGLGPCLLLHAALRAFHSDYYLEYIGGATVSGVMDVLYVAIAHVVAPLAGLLHLVNVPLVNPLRPMLLASVVVSYAALLHDAIASGRTDRVLYRWDRLALYASSIGSAAGMALLTETGIRVGRGT